uniref:Uncharacterized protein n=1 Tax=Oryzias melastigma TaxID=30732 RepID=A0A3B3CQ88_ORYME
MVCALQSSKSRCCSKHFGHVQLHSQQPARTLSSAPSEQSLSPSHFQRRGMHVVLVYVINNKSFKRHSSFKHSLHLLPSSELSPQSSAPSHTQRLGMQRWFVH